MNTTSTISTTILQIIMQPSGGIVGVVNDLLDVCRRHDLQLAWQDGRCYIRSTVGDWEEWIDVPVRKSIFRAILARIATLCNEQRENSVSPYGGRAELSGGEPPATTCVTFVNTPSEQKLLIRPGA